MAYEYFIHDSPYKIVAFSAEKEYIKQKSKFGLPIIPFEIIETIYSPKEYVMFIAIGYMKLNYVRAKFYSQAKEKGYELISYISPKAFIWHNVEIGENCFILEDNVLQAFVKIGNNVILWSGNHIGHGTVIHNHCYISSHVVISGFCDIGENCFVGVNATFGDTVKVGKNCLIAAGTTVVKSISEGKVYYNSIKMQSKDFKELSAPSREMFEPPEVNL